MRSGLISLTAYIFIISIISSGYVKAQDFRARKIADKIFAIENIKDGDAQLVIESEKGLVVLNSFWSEITARNYKKEIIRLLNRDDFLYLIDLVDRLDMFGGNAAYKGIPIIGQKAFEDKYKGKDAEVKSEVDDLIEMWRWKENVARERLPSHKPGSEEEANEQRWINTCKQRADELEQGFSLMLPTEIYEDRKTLDLGDLTLNLIWFGKAGYEGMSVIQIPELKLAIIPGFILHPQHLAPYPQPEFKRLDVPRWIQVLEGLLEGNNRVETVLCGMNGTDIWSGERALTHLNYIRKLWNDISAAEAQGRDLPEIQQQFSLDNDFAFVKEMQVYRDYGDDWIRPQHQAHVRLFFLQHKNPASEIISDMGLDSLSQALAKIKKLRNEGADIYVAESSINSIGYYLLSLERFADAVEILKFNVEAFPESFNAYDSFAEALMKSGDTENAIINYKKSLELNPENKNAKEMLQTLENQ